MKVRVRELRVGDVLRPTNRRVTSTWPVIKQRRPLELEDKHGRLCYVSFGASTTVNIDREVSNDEQHV